MGSPKPTKISPMQRISIEHPLYTEEIDSANLPGLERRWCELTPDGQAIRVWLSFSDGGRLLLDLPLENDFKENMGALKIMLALAPGRTQLS